MATVDQHYEHAVPVEQLEPTPDNPNQGDVGAISQSIETLGFYGAVIAVPVYDESSGERIGGRIVAGEHRWRAAIAVNEPTVPVLFLNTSDDDARRILIGDNRYAQLGHMDAAAVVEYLQTMAAETGSLAGTGFDADDLDKMVKELNTALSFGQGSADQSADLKEGFFVIIDAGSEANQHALFERLSAEGLSCRLSTT